MKVVYHSFEGRYSDNPRALYEAWTARRPGDDHTWISAPGYAADFPPGVQTVEPSGPRCVQALEEADLLIANAHTDLDWNKRREATYLQTWHGTPLKRIHRDSLQSPAGRLKPLDRDVDRWDLLDRDVDRWDLLLSPNSASTDVLRHAFRFHGAMAETGYPRNDALTGPDREQIRHKVRDSLGVAEDETLVFYTPTWRDDDYSIDQKTDVALELQLNRLTDQLGPGYRVMVRMHYLLTDRRPALTDTPAFDVSTYPEITDLYLAADVMVTDYSSTMFDFAITGKPLIFYTYDLAHYRDQLRGFYFDLEPVAPGPMVHTQDELTDALLDLPGLSQRYTHRYRRFQQRFCHLDDGRATDRVLNLLWEQRR